LRSPEDLEEAGQSVGWSWKRLRQGRFHWWPESAVDAVRELEARELQLVVWNGDPSRAAV